MALLQESCDLWHLSARKSLAAMDVSLEHDAGTAKQQLYAAMAFGQ
jgi:hypothetical protein